MKLKEYLEKNGIKKADFAEAIGVKPISLSRYYSKGKNRRRPGWETLMRIHDVTKGKVTPDDFVQGKEDE